MGYLGHNLLDAAAHSAIVVSEANSGIPLKGDFERMAHRRFQNPKPEGGGSGGLSEYGRTPLPMGSTNEPASA